MLQSAQHLRRCRPPSWPARFRLESAREPPDDLSDPPRRTAERKTREAEAKKGRRHGPPRPTNRRPVPAQGRLHATRWKEQGDASLGLSSGDAQALQDLVAEATAAAEEYRRLESAARAANEARRIAMKRARGSYGALVTRIDGFAKLTKDPDIWARARLSRPGRPGPRPTPPRSEPRSLTLLSRGEIEVRFDGGGQGVLYEIQRRVLPLKGPFGPWETISPGAGKRFVDECPPVGVRQIDYQARARRPGRKGPFGPASVGEWSWSLSATFGCEEVAHVVEKAPERAA